MNNYTNPVLDEVKNKYLTIEKMVSIFVKNPEAAMRGVLVSGDAGFGKTHYTKLGLHTIEDINNVDYVKGSSITAAAMFCKLYQSKDIGQVLVLDDVDIIHKAPAERNTILDMFKAATEPTIEDRTIEWGRASINQLMKENDIPSKFIFKGSIVWITNEPIEAIADKAKTHWNAISSRFRQIPVWLNEQEKLMYTLHLIEDVDILGPNCNAKTGGYSADIIKKTTEYIRKNWKYMNDVSPRISISIADTIENFPNEWETYCEYQFINQQ
jgi:hypothetical protein